MDAKEVELIMDDAGRLEHVCRCLIEIRQATEEIQKRYGFKTWTSFKQEQDFVSGAIPDDGIEIDGYKIYPAKKNIYAVSGGKSIGQITKIKTVKL